MSIATPGHPLMYPLLGGDGHVHGPVWELTLIIIFPCHDQSLNSYRSINQIVPNQLHNDPQ